MIDRVRETQALELQIQIPVFRDDLLAEGLLRLALGQREAAARIDPARGHEFGTRP